MSKIAFIGLGNMGLPMARNLITAGHSVTGFDLVAEVVEALVAAGGTAAESAEATLDGADIAITMLPAGPQVASVYGASIIGKAAPGTLLIDCSTIDVATARKVAGDAEAAGYEMIDAPVSGGTGGAEAGTLTFMVGGPDAAVAKARPYLNVMGGNIVHAGGAGNGQAVKICNNMILGINMIGVCEGFNMGEKLGVDPQTIFDVVSTSSGSSWAVNNYCPVPGPVPTSPANRDYQAGFTAAMMTKDLHLAQDAAESCDASTIMGRRAAELFDQFIESGNGESDFSGIMKMIKGV